MRTGNEPVTARSPLRMRFWLSIWGVLWMVAGATAFSLAARPGWAAACATLALIALTDLVLVLRHMRQGPHFQPGPEVPPYAPPDDEEPPPGGEPPGERRRPGEKGPGEKG